MNPYQQDFAYLDLNETQQAIHRTFIDLYAQNPKVNVRQLCKQVPIARSTFYSYYLDIEALKTEIEDNIIAQLLAHNHQLLANGDDFVTATFSFVTTHERLFKSFLVEQTNLCFIDKWKTAIKYNFYPIIKKSHKENLDLTLEIFAAAVVAGFTYLLAQQEDVNLAELKQVIAKFLE